MPDFTKKIMKNCADDLQAGEELLQATVGQPTGTFSRQAIGAGESGMAASVPKDKQLLIGLTDRRILFFEVGAMSGNAKELAAAVELRDVHGMSVEKHKMTYSLTVTFADNSARIFECVRMTKPQDIVDAFDTMKGTRAA